MLRPAIAALVLGLIALPAMAQQQQRLRGTVVGLDDAWLTMKTSAGERVVVALKPGFALVGIVTAAASDIKPGSFIGVGGRAQADGTIRAIQVFVFPDAMRGRGEGHRAWGVLPEATMTNATVESTVAGTQGPDVMLAYPGGEKRIVIPPEANVITAVAAEKAALATGAEVSLVAQKQPDDSLATDRVNVAIGGAKLPL
jgi:hypothetical protein